MIKYAIVLKPSQLSSNGPVQRPKISKNSATHPEKNKPIPELFGYPLVPISL